MTVSAMLLMVAAPTQATILPPEREIPALELLLDTNDNKQDWTEDDRLIAAGYAKEAGTLWRSCLDRAEGRFVNSKEAVETVATAVLGACLKEQRLYQRALAGSLRGRADPTVRDEEATKVIETLRADRREQVISELVDARLKPSKPR